MTAQKYIVSDFPSGKDTCSAWFYPSRKKKSAKTAVIMAHGFSAEKTWNLPVFAEYFQKNGLNTLIFDYRTCGASSGAPRNFLSPSRQVEDYASAMQYCQKNHGIEKFILWGVSFSGGHVLQIAAKKEFTIIGVCALVPHLTPIPAILKLGLPKLAAVGGLAIFAELQYQLLQKEIEIPITAPPGKQGFLTFPGWYDDITKYVKENPNYWENRMPVRLLLEMLTYYPLRSAHKIDCPVQLIYGVRDNGIDPNSIRTAAARIKQSETVSLTIKHFEGMNRNYRDRIAAMQMDFFSRKLEINT